MVYSSLANSNWAYIEIIAAFIVWGLICWMVGMRMATRIWTNRVRRPVEIKAIEIVDNWTWVE